MLNISFNKMMIYFNCHLNYLSKKYFRDDFSKPEKLNDINSPEKLKLSLSRAVSEIPFYENIPLNIASNGIEKDLLKFPIITKKDLLENKRNLYPKKRLWFFTGKTSGTTGTPLEIYRSYKSVIFENAFIRRNWMQVGFKKNMKRVTLRGDRVVHPKQKSAPFWFFNRYDNQLIISSRHLKNGHFQIITDKIKSFSPYLIEAYPSTIYELAYYLKKENRQLEIPYIFTGSEMLYTYQRELIEKQFCGKVMDFYGMAERVAFASECTHGNLHMNTDYSHVEILGEDGNPTDNYGYITGTTYHNEAMPLIRYQLSDITRWKKGFCLCGSAFPMIEPIRGKFEDILYGGKGDAISPSVLTFAFKGLSNIRKSQVAQTAKTKWEVRIVPDDNFSDIEKFKLIHNIKTMVDPDIDIDVLMVDDIPKMESGKFKWVVNEYRNLCI